MQPFFLSPSIVLVTNSLGQTSLEGYFRLHSQGATGSASRHSLARPHFGLIEQRAAELLVAVLVGLARARSATGASTGRDVATAVERQLSGPLQVDCKRQQALSTIAAHDEPAVMSSRAIAGMPNVLDVDAADFSTHYKDSSRDLAALLTQEVGDVGNPVSVRRSGPRHDYVLRDIE